jgi:hypothetical protein
VRQRIVNGTLVPLRITLIASMSSRLAWAKATREQFATSISHALTTQA